MTTVDSASTSQPNTPETDRQAMVRHTVNGTQNGKKVTVQVYATDPIDAINRARNLPDDAWLERN